MAELRIGLTGLLLLTALTLTTGCMPAALLSTEGHADRIHKQMHSIHKAAMDYQSDHGTIPFGDYRSVKEDLISGGYIKRFPIPHPSVFGRENLEGYRFDPEYDKMDAGPTPDSTIVLWGLKDDICKAFNNRYSSNQSGPTIYDREAADNKYPGESIGRHMLIYALKWQSKSVDDCEVNWVLEYSE